MVLESSVKSAYEIVSGNTHDLRDVSEFIDTLNETDTLFEPLVGTNDRTRTGAARCDGRHRRLLGLPRARATDRRSDLVALQKDPRAN
jgi:hypothetical protein